jgi:hypothetical protein
MNAEMAQARQFRVPATGSDFEIDCLHLRDQVIGVKLLKTPFYVLLQLDRC